MEFYTIDSKLIIDKNVLIIKRIKHDPTNRYWFHSFILIAVLIAFQVDRAINEKPRAWILAIVALIWIYPHLERLFKILFVYKWGNRIRISDIKEINNLPADNELETSIRIRLHSGRQKYLTFRTAEKQAENFVDFLQQQRQTVRLSTGDGYS